MLKDALLVFARNQRPPGVVGFNGPHFPFPLGYPYPPQNGEASVLDLKHFGDLGQGQTVTAHFRIDTTFAGSAGNLAAFTVAVADQEDLSVPGEIYVIAQSQILELGAMTAGSHYQLPIPPLGNLARFQGGGFQTGRRYLSLGMRIAIAGGDSDYTQGGVTAWIAFDETSVPIKRFPRAYTP